MASGHFRAKFALAQQGDLDEAIVHYREAIRINPGKANAHDGLAFALVKKQRFAEAIQEYEQVLHQLGRVLLETGQLDEGIKHCSEAGRFTEASTTARQALAAAVAQGQADLADQIRQRLTLYGSRQSYREDRLPK